jgi:hypothetical protein
MFTKKSDIRRSEDRIDVRVSQLSRLARELDEKEERIRNLEKKVKKLICEHRNIGINDVGSGYAQKVCKDCGKVLDLYKTEEDLLKGMCEFHKEKLAELEEKLKEYK